MNDWRGLAECLKSPIPDAWFSKRDDRPGREAAEYALGFCRRCPVQAECLEVALTRDERWGIWGGRTNTQRGSRPSPGPTVGGSA